MNWTTLVIFQAQKNRTRLTTTFKVKWQRYDERGQYDNNKTSKTKQNKTKQWDTEERANTNLTGYMM